MKVLNFLMIFLCSISGVFAQKYLTRTGKISFFSQAPLENITAENNQVNAVLDASSGKIAFVVVIRSFDFEKQLMEEHFNENYMHSDKYPKSTFEGEIVQPEAVNYTKDGTYSVEVTGKLTIHGVTKEVKEKGQIIVKGSGASVEIVSEFYVALADYQIRNDRLKNIAENIRVNVNATLNKQ